MAKLKKNKNITKFAIASLFLLILVTAVFVAPPLIEKFRAARAYERAIASEDLFMTKAIKNNSPEELALRTMSAIVVRGILDDDYPPIGLKISAKSFDGFVLEECSQALKSSNKFEKIKISAFSESQSFKENPLNLAFTFVLRESFKESRSSSVRAVELLYNFTRARAVWTQPYYLRLTVDTFDWANAQTVMTGRNHPAYPDNIRLPEDEGMQEKVIRQAVFARCKTLADEVEPNYEEAIRIEKEIFKRLHIKKL